MNGTPRRTGLALLVLLLVLSAPARAQDNNVVRDFVNRIAGAIFAAAWPTAAYERWSLTDVSAAPGGYDAAVRLSGKSGFGGGPLDLDLVLKLRDGRLADIVVRHHNAILAEPFSTAKAIAGFVAGLAESYGEDQRAPAPGPSPPPVFTVRVQNGCFLGLNVWLHYRLPEGEWVTNGSWQVPGLTTQDLAVNTSEGSRPLRVTSRVVYSYAEPVVSDTRLEWAGDASFAYGDRTLRMRTDTLSDDGSGNLVLARSCSNLRQLGVLGEDAGRYEYNGTAYTAGARILRVEPGSLAERIGLRPNDVVYNIGGEEVTSWEALVRLVARSGTGPMVLNLIRGQQNLRFEVPAPD